MDTEKIINSIVPPTLAGDITAIKIAFVIISLIFLASIVYFLRKSPFAKFLFLEDVSEFFTWRPYGAVKVVKNWNAIRARMDSGLESEYKLAVIEADSLLSDILSKMGYAGETLGEKLQTITSATLPNIEQIKEVHRIRSNIVHDPDYKLSLDEAGKILSVYEKALETLEVF